MPPWEELNFTAIPFLPFGQPRFPPQPWKWRTGQAQHSQTFVSGEAEGQVLIVDSHTPCHPLCSSRFPVAGVTISWIILFDLFPLWNMPSRFRSALQRETWISRFLCKEKVTLTIILTVLFVKDVAWKAVFQCTSKPEKPMSVCGMYVKVLDITILLLMSSWK